MVKYTTDSCVTKPLSTPTIRVAKSMFTNLGSKDTTNYSTLQRSRRTTPSVPITTGSLLQARAGAGRSKTTASLGNVPDPASISTAQLKSFGQVGAGLTDSKIGSKIIHPVANFAQSLKNKIKNPFS